jgi:hypothetical protein
VSVNDHLEVLGGTYQSSAGSTSGGRTTVVGPDAILELTGTSQFSSTNAVDVLDGGQLFVGGSQFDAPTVIIGTDNNDLASHMVWAGGALNVNTIIPIKTESFRFGFDLDPMDIADGTLMPGVTIQQLADFDIQNFVLTNSAVATHDEGNFSIRLGRIGQGGDAEYHLSGDAKLSARGVDIGHHGNGVFTQSDGTVQIGLAGLVLGRHDGDTGEYTMSGGQLIVADDIIVGRRGHGEFAQTGGVIEARLISVGDTDTGVFQIDQGHVKANHVSVGPGTATGHFIQNGGTVELGRNSQSQSLHIGSTQTIAGESFGAIYDMNDGVLDLTDGGTATGERDLEVGWGGKGLFRQNGGQVFARTLTIGARSGDSVYMMNNGSLSAVTILLGNDVNDDAGYFEQSGGTVVEAGQIQLAFGQWAQTGGVAHAAFTEIGRRADDVMFEITGGQFASDRIVVGSSGAFDPRTTAALLHIGGNADVQADQAFIGKFPGHTNDGFEFQRTSQGLQDGGTSQFGLFTVNAPGQFELSGGNMSIDGGLLLRDGLFDFNNGSPVLTIEQGAYANFADGQLIGPSGMFMGIDSARRSGSRWR